MRMWRHVGVCTSSLGRSAGLATAPPPPPAPRRAPPVPRGPPRDLGSGAVGAASTSFQRGAGSPAVPFYIFQKFHKDLGQWALQGPSSTPTIIAAILKRRERVEFSWPDLDASLNALITSRMGHLDPGDSEAGAPLDSAVMHFLLGCVQRYLQRCTAPGAKFEQPLEERHLASMSWALASLVQFNLLEPEVTRLLPDLFTLLEAAILHVTPDHWGVGHIAITAWAFAKAGAGSPELMMKLGDAALQRLDQCEPKNLANLAFAFGTTKIRHELMDFLVDRVVAGGQDGLDKFDGRNLAQIVWGLAALLIREPALMQATSLEVSKKMETMGHVSLGCCLWAYATLREPAGFLHLAMDHFEKKLQFQTTPHGISIVLWSLARFPADHRIDAFFTKAIDSYVRPNIDKFRPQDVSHTLWALATVRVEDPDVYSNLARHCAVQISEASVQALTNAAWACAKMGVDEKTFFNTLEPEVLRQPISTWSPQSLVTICWSLVELGRRPVKLLVLILEELRARVLQFNDRDLVTLTLVLYEDGWPDSIAPQRDAALARIAGQVERRNLPYTRRALKAASGHS